MSVVVAAPAEQTLTLQTAEVAPGVFRLRAGNPEPIVPSTVRQAARLDALGTMPKVTAPPVRGIKAWRMARGCRIELPLGAEEVIYRLGLQCKHLEQNGWRRTLYAASGDDNGAGMGHAPVPLYVSTAGYAVLVDTARAATFSVGEVRRLANGRAPEAGGNRNIVTDVARLYGPQTQAGAAVYVDVPAAHGVDIYLFGGPRLGDAIARYNLYSGGGCLPSLAGLGPHYIFGAMLNASSVLPMIDHFKQEQIPFTTVALEPEWETHAYSSSYLWNTGKFPHLYQAYSDYHLKGIPPVRPLAADWPEDASTRHLVDEWMLGPDLLVAPLTEENAFSELYRVGPSAASPFHADAGVQLSSHDEVLSLDIVGTGDGLPGASLDFDLKAGPCAARQQARGAIGHMAIRLRRVEENRQTDVGELYQDDIPLDGRGWKELIYRFNVPSDGHYRFSVGKAYFQRLPNPRRLKLRDVSFEQRTGDAHASWKRMVYFPAGTWRDFWTGAPLRGGDRREVTTTPEHPPVFARDNTLLPLADPVVTLDENTVFTVHLVAYGDNLRPCQLLEDDGVSFDYERGKWATVTLHSDGTINRPAHGQPLRYRVAGQAERPLQALKTALKEDNTAAAIVIHRDWAEHDKRALEAVLVQMHGVQVVAGSNPVAPTI